MAITQESIDEVKARADIVLEVGTRVELKKAGASFVGLCPFHGEKSPSFNVSQSKQFYHCFGCGKNGDVFQFLMEHDGMEFHEAVKDLGERLGVQVEEDQDEASIRAGQAQRKAASSLEDLCEVAAGFYRTSLRSSAEASRYVFESRGLSAEVVDRYGIGYAPYSPSRKPLAAVFAEYTSSALLEAGLVKATESHPPERYDAFRDRLIFPIRDVRGRCIGFGGRVINGRSPSAPKYLNTGETPIFHKNKVLFGLHEARASIAKTKLAFVTEGYMDVVSMANHGLGNAVAAMGTALTEEHVRLLLRFTDRVCFLFDGDSAGQAAAWKSLRVVLPFLAPKHAFKFVTLPGNQDPDEFLKAHGKDAFKEAVKTAPTLSQYLLARLTSTFGAEGRLDTAEAKTQFLVAGEELVNLIPAGNPLQGLLLQELDAAVGRPRRLVADPAHGAVKGRLAQAGQSGKKPWLPREEWLKQRDRTNSSPVGSFRATSIKGAGLRAAPTFVKKTVWQSLADAVNIAPRQAALLAPQILRMLDPDAPQEEILIQALQRCANSPDLSDRHPPDELQGAIDLLGQAHQVIIKQRKLDVKASLKALYADGELSETEYVEQMQNLG